MNNKARGANYSQDQQLVSHRILSSNYLTQSCLTTEQSDSDQDDMIIVIPDISSNFFVEQVIVSSNIAGRKAVNGSANQNLLNSFMESELNIMHGERRGIHVIQHNTNNICKLLGLKYVIIGFNGNSLCING